MKIGATTRNAGEPGGEVLAWDSEFWNLRIGRGAPSLDAWAIENTVGCMWALVSADEPGEVQRAEGIGYRFMDVRVGFERKLSPNEVFYGSSQVVADYDPKWHSLERLVKIARESHRITRFYADDRLDDDRCDDLYENWLRNSIDGWATAVLVAIESRGYVTVHVDRETQTGSIGLIAVAESSRGSGFGHALVESALKRARREGATRMTVVTQGRNIQAQRVFQRAGFRVERTDLWLHKWYTEKEAA